MGISASNVIFSVPSPTDSDRSNQNFTNVSQWNEVENISLTKMHDPYYRSNFIVLRRKSLEQGFDIQRKNQYEKDEPREVEKYPLFFNNQKQYQNYNQCYLWRRCQHFGRTKNQSSELRNPFLYLVKALYLEPFVSNSSICTTSHESSLFLERIPIRLNEISDIPLNQGLYLIYTAMRGFHLIWDRFESYLEISQEMVGINMKARVKVWFHQNFSQAYPDFAIINEKRSEKDFVASVIEVCETAIDFQGVPETFSAFVSKLGGTGFTNFVETFQKYLRLYSLTVSRQMSSIKELFQLKGLSKRNRKRRNTTQFNTDRFHQYEQKYRSEFPEKSHMRTELKLESSLSQTKRKTQFQAKESPRAVYFNDSTVAPRLNFTVNAIKKTETAGRQRINTQRSANQLPIEQENIHRIKPIAQDFIIQKRLLFSKNPAISHITSVPKFNDNKRETNRPYIVFHKQDATFQRVSNEIKNSSAEPKHSSPQIPYTSFQQNRKRQRTFTEKQTPQSEHSKVDDSKQLQFKIKYFGVTNDQCQIDKQIAADLIKQRSSEQSNQTGKKNHS